MGTGGLAAASNNMESLNELVELLQNPAQKEKLLKLLPEEPADGELKPPPATTTAEGLISAVAAMEADADLPDGLDGLPERADVATQTNKPKLPSAPKLASR